MRRAAGVIAFGPLQFLWGWTGALPDQWLWYDTESASVGVFHFYGVAFGETFLGIVR